MGDAESMCPGESECWDFRQADDSDEIYQIGESGRDLQQHRPEENMFIGRRLGQCSACVGCSKLSTKPGQAIAITADIEIVATVEQFGYEIRAGRPVDLSEIPALLWKLWVTYKALLDMYERARDNRMAASLDALGMFK